MKALRTLTILFALALMCLPAPSAAAAEKPFKLDICAMPEHESFIFWYAKEQGWDKDEGLDFQIHFFQTGMDQLEALPAKQWVVGGTGTVPILVGALRYNTYLIGIANDESWVNAVTVRPDNPALKVKGWNPEYPNLLGSPETVKGKTFLYTQSSSQHFGMAEACDAIAENPPKTFREAMQLHYFIFVGLFIEGNAGGYSPGRMDQNLYPYYKRDVEAGILTDAEALELIECMWITFGEQIWYWNEPAATHYAGFCAFQNVCIGGVDMDGLDAVNPLSYLMLQATIDTQMVQPSLSVRLSRKNPEDFFLKIAELIQTGSGFPAIYSDEIGMKQLMKKGIPPELAHDWVGLGCVEANMPGKMSQWSSAGHYNIAAAVEFALSNGVHLKSGKKLGLETGDPASFTTFEQFRNAVHAQLDHLLRTFSSMQNLLELLHQRYLPNPVASMVLLDCVEKGKDLMRGGARYNTGPGMNGNGVADYADSMVAVKKLVFDEKKVDMATLADAVKHDFKGYEPLLRLIDEEAPKWGNDDPEADAMVIDLTSFIIKKIAAFRGLLGNQKLPALYPVSSNVPQGMAVGALPSGRRAFRPIAEGCSPCQGADRTGPTAVLRSLGKLPHTCIDGGTLLNLKFTPASVEGEAGRIRLSAFLKSFLDLDVFHVQFNVVGHEVLRCAQAHPEEYKSLLVRVAGYSAYFVELSREVQDDILSRTAHAL